MSPLSRSNLVDLWDQARSGFWLVPSAMTLAAALLALGLVALDHRLKAAGVEAPAWLAGVQGEAAQTILSTIASSMLTVAGVVFSITIVALQLASNQFGPRLLRTFMVDIGNQVVLGAFIAAFLYCLIVLAASRSGEQEFVPRMALAFGGLLGIVNVGVLIFFIHHIASSIRVENVIEELARELREAIEAYFPSEVGRGVEPDADTPRGPARDILCTIEGYIRHVDEIELMAAGAERDIVARLDQRPGDYVIEGAVLLSVWPPERVDEATAARLRTCVVIGPTRTPLQDPGFAQQQLVELAVRALSAAFNDPFTAVACVNRLGQALSRLARVPMPSAHRLDKQGRLRLIAPPVSLIDMASHAFDPIARVSRANMDVVLALLNAILAIARHAQRASDRDYLVDFARSIHEDARGCVERERDRQLLERAWTELTARHRAADMSEPGTEG